MTLRELYDKARKCPTPGLAFIQEVMAVTKKTEITVRRWLSGEVVPDELTRETLANHFGIPADELFPQIKN